MPDNEDARTWFNCVEEMVFIDDDFNSDLAYQSSGDMAIQRRKIQAVLMRYRLEDTLTDTKVAKR
jgi:hypothetical protein